MYVLRARSQELSKMRMKEADREVHGFGSKLTTCECRELHIVHGDNLDAACMNEIGRRERAVYRQYHTTFVNGCVFF